MFLLSFYYIQYIHAYIRAANNHIHVFMSSIPLQATCCWQHYIQWVFRRETHFRSQLYCLHKHLHIAKQHVDTDMLRKRHVPNMRCCGLSLSPTNIVLLCCVLAVNFLNLGEYLWL